MAHIAQIVAAFAVSAVLAVNCGGCAGEVTESDRQEGPHVTAIDRVIHTEEEWKSILPPERYRILREKGTEPPFLGEYEDQWEDGVYHCYACDLPLFDSGTKFHSGSGWPSFWEPIGPVAVEEHEDTSHGMTRVEVTCARCDGHLGHVFPDGPPPTGLRYCINSLSLKFAPR